MNDAAIRPFLYSVLKEGVYVDELPTGSTRADVVHITPEFMHGYELKGDNDTLKRVPNQLECYSRAYDYVTFIVTQKHLDGLLVQLPEWVGVQVVSHEGLFSVRTASHNLAVRRRELAFLLLAEEIKDFLRVRGEKGLSRLRNWELGAWLANAEHIPLAELGAFVRRQLIDRMPQRLQRRANMREQRAETAAARKRGKEAYKAQLEQCKLDEPEWYADNKAYLEAELLRM